MSSADGGVSRAELERRAYGRAETDEQRVAADAALHKLAELDRPAPPVSEPVVEVPEVPAPVPAAAEVSAPSVRWRQPRISGAIAALASVLVVVVATAVVLTFAIGSNASVGSAVPTSRPTPIATGNPAAAFKILLRPQSSADKQYPMRAYASVAGIQPASIHVALQDAATGDTLWVARSENDICMMWTSQEKAGLLEGGSQCLTPGAFARHGIRLSNHGSVWSWNGMTFTISSN